jgi:hypothetical protein
MERSAMTEIQEPELKRLLDRMEKQLRENDEIMLALRSKANSLGTIPESDQKDNGLKQVEATNYCQKVSQLLNIIQDQTQLLSSIRYHFDQLI